MFLKRCSFDGWNHFLQSKKSRWACALNWHFNRWLTQNIEFSGWFLDCWERALECTWSSRPHVLSVSVQGIHWGAQEIRTHFVLAYLQWLMRALWGGRQTKQRATHVLHDTQYTLCMQYIFEQASHELLKTRSICLHKSNTVQHRRITKSRFDRIPKTGSAQHNAGIA